MFIYFDLGNVLLTFSHRQAASQLALAAGISEEQAWNAVFQSGLLELVETGKLSEEQFYHQFCEKTASKSDFQTLKQAGSAIFEINMSMIPLLVQLRYSGIGLGILSNTSFSHWEYCTKNYSFLQGIFQQRILSYEVNAMKPAQQIYQEAVQRAGVPADEIFFMDDREENVNAAKAFGIDAVLFQSAPQIASELRQRELRLNY